MSLRILQAARNAGRLVQCKRSTLLSVNHVAAMRMSTAPATIKPEDIVHDCSTIRQSIQALNDKYKGPLEKSSQKNTILPFVLLVGNHSSGKSSLINYVCERKVQTAGVAPTDDSFTIIVPGPSDVDRDGPSFIGDPDMGFSGLRTFGPNLVHHTKLKVRSNIAVKNFMLVDTPGMIDSPMVRDQYGATRHAVMDRGYDFEGVVRWYAERADVILLSFDPDKPGTTGETLSVLTNSLVGLEHKLLIILNKADQFRKIHDFARAYGSLCWNLSKVIQRKDLPRIYTMCLPKSFQVPNNSNPGSDSTASAGEGESSLGRGLVDLEETREEVVQEILNAPKRRVDNEITRLTDSVSLLHMHLTIVEDLIKQYRQATFRSRMSIGAMAVTTMAASVGSFLLAFPIELAASIGVSGLAGTGALYWWQTSFLTEKAAQLITEDAMIAAYKRIYARRIAEKDESTASLWARVQDHLIMGLTTSDFKAMDKVRSADLKDLERILDYDIPNLRRKAAPAFNKKM